MEAKYKKELLDIWSKVESFMGTYFPYATKDELRQITKSAMVKALTAAAKRTASHQKGRVRRAPCNP